MQVRRECRKEADVVSLADLQSSVPVGYSFEIVSSLWITDGKPVGIGQTVHSKFHVISGIGAIPVEDED